MAQPKEVQRQLMSFSLTVARQRKERNFPELSGEGGRARSVVLLAKVVG